MAYSNIDKPNQYFDTATYAGSESSQDITSLNFQPDWVWIKNRTTTPSHQLTDVVRGVHNVIYSNLTNAENQSSSQGVGAFLSNGFQVDGNIGGVNDGGSNFVAWNWLAGGTASSNTDGSITSSVSANTTSGFSIVSYTGNGTGGATVGHGIDTPKMIIVKNRDDTDSWEIYHASLGETKYLQFTIAAAGTNTNRWNDTSPTSSVFSLGTEAGVNQSGENFIAYCFAEKKGFSKFGSFTGNGSTDGTFIYTGFKPAFFIHKKTNSTSNWYLYDNKRTPSNIVNKEIYVELSNGEASVDRLDFVSNGVKFRSSTSSFNGSGDSYIYMAFAENPLVGSNLVPNNAR